MRKVDMRLIGFSVGDYAYFNYGGKIQRVEITYIEHDEFVFEEPESFESNFIAQYTMLSILGSKGQSYDFSTRIEPHLVKLLKKDWCDFLDLPPDEMSRIYHLGDFKPAF